MHKSFITQNAFQTFKFPGKLFLVFCVNCLGTYSAEYTKNIPKDKTFHDVNGFVKWDPSQNCLLFSDTPSILEIHACSNPSPIFSKH
jgi:hypothetical protein